MASINLTKTELARGVKGVVPQTESGVILEDYRRRYRRVRHTAKEKQLLASQGLQPVLSSNVSAVGQDGNNLIIRFHNGALYSYKDQGNRYKDILSANSKGKWVWNNLRRKNVPYQKIGVFKLPSDEQITDEEVFDTLDKLNLDNILGTTAIINQEDEETGLTYKKYLIGGIVFNFIEEQINGRQALNGG